MLPILLILERWIHRHLRGVALLLTGRQDWSIYIYALVLLPGVALHEASHWVMAKLMGVRTGKFSIFPRQQDDGSLQLGYVEYYRDASLGPLRESVIGAAPLISGLIVITLIGRHIFQLPNAYGLLYDPQLSVVLDTLKRAVNTSDLFVWLYLLFAVSNAMMPSPSDRRAWPMLLVVVATVVITLVAFDQQRALISQVIVPLSRVSVYISLAFIVTIVVDLIFIVIILLIELIFGRLLQKRMTYS